MELNNLILFFFQNMLILLTNFFPRRRFVKHKLYSKELNSKIKLTVGEFLINLLD